MALEIKVGPPQITIHEGHTVLVTEPDGSVAFGTEKGLWFFDTRLISTWAIYCNGADWDLLNSAAVTHYAGRIYLTNRAFATADGDVPARTVSLVLSRSLGGGLHEKYEVTNHGRSAIRFQLEVAFRCDFADIFEVKASRIPRRGRITSDWDEDGQNLLTSYRNGAFHRAVGVRAKGGTALMANGRLNFDVSLAPGATWTGALLYDLLDGDQVYAAPEVSTLDDTVDCPQDRALADWQARVMKLDCSNDGFRRLYAQSVDDMASLRLPFPGTDHTSFVPAAGLPWFVALFGRDSLIVSLQNAMIQSDFARGALEVLGRWQATEVDDYRDAEPGKILHELRSGELAFLKLIPHTPYYGTADATPLFLITLHQAWMCTGDRALLEQHLHTAEGCLRWIDEYGDRDGDGFQEYATRSSLGYENVGWKDSGEALVNEDGSLVKGPKALVELQGYVYDAWLRMAAVFDALDRPADAERLRGKARALFDQFNQAFWNEERGFYAFCLDGDKRPVWTVASNPGQLLWSGIVPDHRAARVAARLMRPDMWSGWGIRTLTMRNPTYNPYSYQNGSVWPHDNGLIAQGLKQYGLAEESNRVAWDISAAASYFTLRQLPELYSGVARDEANFPVQYLGANVPQAWAAGAVFSLLQAMLGFQPDAPRDRLYLDPALPDWLPDIQVRDLSLGRHRFDIDFWREGADTAFKVLRGNRHLVQYRPMHGWRRQLRAEPAPAV